MNYQSNKHVFGTKADDQIITMTCPSNQYFRFEKSIGISDNIQYIKQLTDLPDPIEGIITLENNKTYIFIDSVDFLGNRLVCGTNQVIKGTSSENVYLSSTGLDSATAFITSTKTIILRDITIIDIQTIFDLDASDSNQVIDWEYFNIQNCSMCGSIKNYGNFIVSNSAWLSFQGLAFDGTFGTIGFMNCLITNGNSLVSLSVESTAVITRRFKVIESSFVMTDGSLAIYFDNSASVPDQGYILTSVNFSGDGSSLYIDGLSSTSNKALFFKNLGISNSVSNGSFYIGTPAATTLVLNTWTKVSGTTTASSINQKFTHSNNRLTYAGSLRQLFRVAYHCSISGTHNDDIQIGISKNGANPLGESIMVQTVDSSGKINNVGLTFYIELRQNDYIELWCRNVTGSRDITAEQINVCVGGEF